MVGGKIRCESQIHNIPRFPDYFLTVAFCDSATICKTSKRRALQGSPRCFKSTIARACQVLPPLRGLDLLFNRKYGFFGAISQLFFKFHFSKQTTLQFCANNMILWAYEGSLLQTTLLRRSYETTQRNVAIGDFQESHVIKGLTLPGLVCFVSDQS